MESYTWNDVSKESYTWSDVCKESYTWSYVSQERIKIYTSSYV